MTGQHDNDYDVVVIGGGAAGLNAALMLARARRTVAVVDAGAPRNAPADGVHGLLGHDGISPAELRDRGHAEVRRYGGHLVPGRVDAVRGEAGDFTVSLTNGARLHGRRVLVTSGLVDELPDEPGLRQRWGNDVVHCPYCHGWEVRDRPIGVLATGPMAIHQALLFRQWSDDVALFTHTSTRLPDETMEQLAARKIRVWDGEVAAVEVADDRIAGLRLADGSLVEREVVVVATRLVAHTDFLAELGLHPVDHPSGVGVHIPVDPAGRTDVAGVWAAGNVTELMAQVGPAAAAGAAAATQINADLIEVDNQAALA
ncbi:MAG: NAD(P)/FAD-dependent oxidoreductase, partial [Stackebrandtia sp.]